LLAIFCLYAVQLLSPLRVNTDAITLLDLSSRLSDGKPYLLNGARPVFPIGIPLLFSFMERMGVATPLGFGGLNLFCLCIAAWSTWIICSSLKLSRLVAMAVLGTAFGNFVFFKHSVIPLTDIPYMAESLLCVALLELSEQNCRISARLLMIFGVLVCMVCAISTRRIGIALIPAVFYSIRPSKQLIFYIKSWFLSSKPRIVACAVGLALLVIAPTHLGSWLFYLPDFNMSGQDNGLAEKIFELFKMRLTDFGEFFLNVPANRAPLPAFAVYAAGAALLVLLLLGICRQLRQLHTVHIYLLSYLVILFVWPYSDARFWIPVLPLLVITAFEGFGFFIKYKIAKIAAVIYFTVYIFASLLAAAYTTRITFSGKDFPEVYAQGAMRQAYLEAWSGKIEPNDETVIVIRRYGMQQAPTLLTGK